MFEFSDTVKRSRGHDRGGGTPPTGGGSDPPPVQSLFTHGDFLRRPLPIVSEIRRRRAGGAYARQAPERTKRERNPNDTKGNRSNRNTKGRSATAIAY